MNEKKRKNRKSSLFSANFPMVYVTHRAWMWIVWRVRAFGATRRCRRQTRRRSLSAKARCNEGNTRRLRQKWLIFQERNFLESRTEFKDLCSWSAPVQTLVQTRRKHWNHENLHEDGACNSRIADFSLNAGLLPFISSLFFIEIFIGEPRHGTALYTTYTAATACHFRVLHAHSRELI